MSPFVITRVHEINDGRGTVFTVETRKFPDNSQEVKTRLTYIRGRYEGCIYTIAGLELFKEQIEEAIQIATSECERIKDGG